MSNFVNFDNSAIQLGYGERNLVFARPASLAALKDLLRDYLQLTCHHTDMRISWASRDHGVLKLVDDAGVAGLWAWCKLELAVDENKAATRSVILRTRYRGSCVSVEAPATLKDCLAAGFQHFGIDPACTDTRVFWRSPNDGLVEVTDDSFFARMGHLWTLQFDSFGRIAGDSNTDCTEATESLLDDGDHNSLVCVSDRSVSPV